MFFQTEIEKQIAMELCVAVFDDTLDYKEHILDISLDFKNVFETALLYSLPFSKQQSTSILLLQMLTCSYLQRFFRFFDFAGFEEKVKTDTDKTGQNKSVRTSVKIENKSSKTSVKVFEDKSVKRFLKMIIFYYAENEIDIDWMLQFIDNDHPKYLSIRYEKWIYHIFSRFRGGNVKTTPFLSIEDEKLDDEEDISLQSTYFFGFFDIFLDSDTGCFLHK